MGVFLSVRGVQALWELPPAAGLGLGALGVAVGLAKGKYVLRKVAAKSAARIAERGDGRCLGGFLSLQSWALVVGMMAGGKYLRSAGLPPWLIGPLLTAVGTGLFLGCAVYWVAWRRRVSGPR